MFLSLRDVKRLDRHWRQQRITDDKGSAEEKNWSRVAIELISQLMYEKGADLCIIISDQYQKMDTPASFSDSPIPQHVSARRRESPNKGAWIRKYLCMGKD